MTLPTVIATGNLTRDPELKIGANGTALVKFSLACNDRRKNPDTGQWEDGDVTFVDVVAFRQLAENVAESVTKGDTVRVEGKLKSSSWETPEGEKRSRFEVIADSVSLDLGRAAAKSQRIQRTTTVSDDVWSTTTAVPF